MNRIVAHVSMAVLGAWLAFRFVSDWPRGRFASGIAVPGWQLQLSYYGLIPWILLGLAFVLMIGKFGNTIAGDRLARAHLFFILYQFVGLFIIARDFGDDGLLAGIYIIAVSITFLLAYVFGVQIGYHIAPGSSAARSRASLTWMVWCIAPCLVVSVLQLLTGSGRDVGGIPRIYGGTSSPNVLGALLLVFAGLVLWNGAPKLSPFNRALLGGTLALFVACFSLSGFVALAFGFAVYALLNARLRGIKIRLSWIIGALLAFALVAYFAEAVLVERFGELQQSDNSLSWRTRTWASYAEFLRDTHFLLLGGGLGFDHLGLDQEPHNEWLRVLLETGLIGLLLFLRVWWILIRGLFEVMRLPDSVLQQRALGMIAIVAAMALWACVDSVLRTAPSALLLWTASGLMIGAARAAVSEHRMRAAQVPPRVPQLNARRTRYRDGLAS